MNISIGGSDEASDFCSLVVDDILKKCQKELKNKANEYNTPGYINIALLLKSMISQENEFHFMYGKDWEVMWSKLDYQFKNNEYNGCEELAKWVQTMYKQCKKQNS